MIVFKLPDLGEGLQEAEIVQWHVQAGDTVAAVSYTHLRAHET